MKGVSVGVDALANNKPSVQGDGLFHVVSAVHFSAVEGKTIYSTACGARYDVTLHLLCDDPPTCLECAAG